tara:strand:- start:16 stop:1077 length:1062 start_codon:yes stop_codon:yes gene_type:complete
MIKNILIIGAGIHGCFIAKYLAKNKNNNIVIIEKEKDICLGSSSATHNRANRGFHYPRSKQTAKECMEAYDYFKNNYNKFLKQIDTYYCIEKNSKTSFKNYLSFFKANNLKYKLIKNSKFLKKDLIKAILKVEEGCFNHDKIKIYLKRELDKKNIKIHLNFNLKKVKRDNKKITLFNKTNKKINFETSTIINSTYDNCNQVIKLFQKDFKKINYTHQLTEVAEVYSKSYIPGITIMDGPFATIMPLVGSKNKYLVYDVENSILEKSKKPITKFSKKTNFKKMEIKLNKYLNNYKIKYLNSRYGTRPIPMNDSKADRSTKILNLNINGIKMLNILEGKYISAPFVGKNLAQKIK